METRRQFVALASITALGGCATVAAPKTEAAPATPQPLSPALSPRGKPLVLAPVHVAEDRVIRTVVGLRPYREAGFVLRGEKLGDKLLVHNYGHGGGGISLSWGTADLAARLGYDSAVDSYAVLGCGAVGLATARLLQRRGGKVIIYAAELPPETTSNVAGGQWWPGSVYDHESATAEFIAQFTAASRSAYRQFQDLVGPHYGVRWTRNYTPRRAGASRRVIVTGPPAGGPALPLADPLEGLAPERVTLGPGEHPFGEVQVSQFDSMMVEPAIYLQAVMEDFLTAGGRLVVRRFQSREQLAALPERTIFNCTGLGARALFGDESLIPARGQLVVLLPQPEVNYNVLSGGFYMFPRTDGIVLGGTFERGVWSLEPDPAATTRILEGNKAIFAAMTTPR